MRAGIWAAVAALALVAGACGGHRNDSKSFGTRDALACVVERGGDLRWAVDQCSRRGFAYDAVDYRSGYQQALACVGDKGGDVAEAAAACRSENGA